MNAGTPNRPTMVEDLLYAFYVNRLDDDMERRLLEIEYHAVGKEADGQLSEVPVLGGKFTFSWRELPIEIQQKIDSLVKVFAELMPSYEVKVPKSDSFALRATMCRVFCNWYKKPPTIIPSQISAMYSFPTKPNTSTQMNFNWQSLSRSQQLLIGNIASWVKGRAWQDLVNQVKSATGQVVRQVTGHKVFLSYKRRSKAEPVAELVAHRLSQQNIEVWYDKWEVKAGDSVAGKIGEGFRDRDACLIFLESHYATSGWCTKEMNTALTKAINDDLVVIPIIVEECDVPELLKDLRKVRLIEPGADELEKALMEITDAIYRVDLNPYR